VKNTEFGALTGTAKHADGSSILNTKLSGEGRLMSQLFTFRDQSFRLDYKRKKCFGNKNKLATWMIITPYNLAEAYFQIASFLHPFESC